MRLLDGAVFVVDRNGMVRYKNLVKKIAEEPDYESVIEAAKEIR